jgi:hypothetical protein
MDLEERFHQHFARLATFDEDRLWHGSLDDVVELRVEIKAARSAPRAFMVSEPCARPTSDRLGASRRDDRDCPLVLSTPLGTER